MQKEQFESMVRELLPAVTDNAMDIWTAYAQDLEREGVEPASHIFDAAYVELMLVKQHQGEETAVRLFNYGEQFIFNYFELRGAASMLEAGRSLDEISQCAVVDGCDPSAEEFEESKEALRTFKEHWEEVQNPAQTADGQCLEML